LISPLYTICVLPKHYTSHASVVVVNAISYQLSAVADSRRPIADSSQFAGDERDRATPVPIPNTVVKPVSADGTALDRGWESRPPPASPKKEPVRFAERAFFL
jgi:hypothetical protein